MNFETLHSEILLEKYNNIVKTNIQVDPEMFRHCMQCGQVSPCEFNSCCSFKCQLKRSLAQIVPQPSSEPMDTEPSNNKPAPPIVQDIVGKRKMDDFRLPNFVCRA